MIDSDFDKWPLHEAPIETFVIDWENKTCTLNLYVFLKKGVDAFPCQIIWKDLIEIQIPFKYPWGGSVYINSQKKNGEKEYIIEMQSGDEIKISAEQIELKELSEKDAGLFLKP